MPRASSRNNGFRSSFLLVFRAESWKNLENNAHTQLITNRKKKKRKQKQQQQKKEETRNMWLAHEAPYVINIFRGKKKIEKSDAGSYDSR